MDQKCGCTIHERFHYRSLEEVVRKASELGVYLPFAKNTEALASPIKAGGHILPNRLGIAPMEGGGFPA